MHKTLKLVAQLEDIPIQKEYSAAFRFAYERVKEGKSAKEIRAMVKANWPELGCWLQWMAILDATTQRKIHIAQETSRQKNEISYLGREKRVQETPRRQDIQR